MRIGLLALAAVAAMAGSLASQLQAQTQSGISGIFQTQAAEDGAVGMVQFGPCGDRFCGKLVKSFRNGAEIASPDAGKNIVANMVDDGGGKFSGGTIWDPTADKTYKSKMVLSGNSLKVSGCVSVICRSQTWTKVK